MTDAEGPSFFDWSIASVPHPGETDIGDSAVVERHGTDYLLATIDGLGHGTEAALAAQVASDVVRRNLAEPLDALLVLCHQAMQATRGAAITIARVTPEGRLSWVGVGNVDAYLLRQSPTGFVPIDSPVLSGGIVGFDLPRMSVREVELRRGDLVALATDGVDRGFLEDIRAVPDLKGLVNQIIDNCAKGTDDALVLVGRYWGPDG